MAPTATAPDATAPASGRGWRPDLSPLQAWPVVLPLLAVVAVFVLYPLVKLVLDSLNEGAGAENYANAVESGAMRRALITTIVSGLIVTALAVIIGGVIAWWLRVTERGAWRVVVWIAVLIPFCMGVVVKNYVFALLFARNGVINDVVLGLGLADEPLQLLYTRGAVVIGILYAMLPYAVFSLYAAFSAIDPALPAAARSMGASRLKAATSVTLPLALRGMIASATIVFAISIGFYVTPVLLGGSSVPFVATLIQDEIFQYFNYPQAAAASVLLLVVAFVVLAIGLTVAGGSRVRSALA